MTETRDSASPPRPPAQELGPRRARLAWIAAGWCGFAVGVVGVLLPGLPTTGPMLLALACFALFGAVVVLRIPHERPRSGEV